MGCSTYRTFKLHPGAKDAGARER